MCGDLVAGIPDLSNLEGGVLPGVEPFSDGVGDTFDPVHESAVGAARLGVPLDSSSELGFDSRQIPAAQIVVQPPHDLHVRMRHRLPLETEVGERALALPLNLLHAHKLGQVGGCGLLAHRSLSIPPLASSRCATRRASMTRSSACPCTTPTGTATRS